MRDGAGGALVHQCLQVAGGEGRCAALPTLLLLPRLLKVGLYPPGSDGYDALTKGPIGFLPAKHRGTGGSQHRAPLPEPALSWQGSRVIDVMIFVNDRQESRFPCVKLHNMPIPRKPTQ